MFSKVESAPGRGGRHRNFTLMNSHTFVQLMKLSRAYLLMQLLGEAGHAPMMHPGDGPFSPGVMLDSERCKSKKAKTL